MSIEWFRSWHGAPTDPKWILIAKRSETQPGIVSAILWALFDHASQNREHRGNVADFDVETYAAFSGFDEATIARVLECLEEKNVIEDGHLSAWEKRQPKREDNSTERVRQHRNAVKRDETHGNARVDKDKIREEKKEPRASAPVVADDYPEDFREQFWSAYPNKVGKPKAIAKLEGVRKRGVRFADVMTGLDRYIASKPPDRAWLNPETFINQERWADQPAPQEANAKPQYRPNVVDVAKRWAEHFESESGDSFEGNSGAVLRLPKR